MKLQFKSGYKYQAVNEPASVQLQYIKPKELIVTPFSTLTSEGYLTGRAHYAWDGPSGPTIDTDNFLPGSYFHDMLYEMIRLGFLPFEVWRLADKEMDVINKRCGMSSTRRWLVRMGLWIAQGSAAKPINKKSIKVIEF